MMKKVFFDHPSGIKLCGLLSNPKNDVNNPVIIIAHGFTSSKDSSSYKEILKKLFEAGLATFAIDLYGHGESEGDFADITITKGKESILSAIEYLKNLGYTHIAVLGSSFGGISAIMAAAETNDLFCLALKSPVSEWLNISTVNKPGHLEAWRENGYIMYDEGGKSLKLNYGIVEDAKKNIAFSVSPKISIPTLIVHSDEDQIVPYEDSVELNKLLKNSKLHTVKGANHNYSSSKKDYIEMSEALSNFLIKESKKVQNKNSS